VGILLGAWWLSHSRAETLCGSDFPVFRAGGELAGTDRLYTAAAAQAIQKRELGCTSASAVFIRLPYFAALMRPWTWMPFWIAFVLWRAANVAAIGVFVWLWPAPRYWTLLACAWSVPLAQGIIVGQDTGFVLMWLAIAAALVERGRGQRGAGLALSMCAAKFHLFVLVPLAFRSGGKRMALGFAMGAGVLLAVSFWVQGAHWPEQWQAAVNSAPIDPGPEMLFNVRGFSHGHAATEAVLALLEAGAVVCVCRWADFSFSLAAAIVGGILISRHQTFADLALLIPVALAAAQHPSARFSRAVAVFLVTPIAGAFSLLMPGTVEFPRLMCCALPFLMAWETTNAPTRNCRDKLCGLSR
jgi:hypothetical protein